MRLMIVYFLANVSVRMIDLAVDWRRILLAKSFHADFIQTYTFIVMWSQSICPFQHEFLLHQEIKFNI